MKAIKKKTEPKRFGFLFFLAAT
ncbi:hypothetical protein MED92_04357 [Neptuniibacter caesariensis]|uniref:Uncharacterized protein n=1 Tax=Neptuniibacter caesariensis TaxID=207954 RepID=A0A7U8C574_NEPCE|nr:hypothetical protein MED92_04357 [Neptuniibacter caesariensis]